MNLLGPQMAKIRVDNQKRINLQHWIIWGPHFKIQNFEKLALAQERGIKNILVNGGLGWPKLSLEPKFHVAETSGG